MSRPHLLAVLGGGGGGVAAAAFAPGELTELAAREASNPELLQFRGGDGGLVLLAVICIVLAIGLVIVEVAND